MKIPIGLLFLLVSKFCFAQTPTFTSSNLPIVIINSLGNTITDEPKVNATMGIIFNGPGQRNNMTDPQNNYNGNIGIEYRGKSSQMFPLKSYGIELRDAVNNSQEKSLLGIPKESDWILYAPYTDKTLMRNVLAYTLSNKLGHWASQCRYVEVVVDNEYRGIYVLMEKIKRGSSNRVVISKLGTTDNSGDAVTGGYIISIDKDPAAFTSKFLPLHSNDKQVRFCNVYPKPDKITPQQNEYIKNYVDSFETALNGNNYQDPINGVRKYADIPSFIDYFLINELSHNVDGYRLSTYLFKDKYSLGGKLTMGPVWDYDLGFRNANYCNGSSTNTWAWQFNATCPDDYWQVPFWWEKLIKDTAFITALKCRYTGIRKDIFSTNGINAFIDSVQSLLSEAQVRHFTKWPILGQYVWPNEQPIPTTYAGEIAMLKSWIEIRNGWLEKNIPDEGACAIGNGNADISIKIIPNPINTNGKIILLSNIRQTVSLQICNGIGQTVYQASIQANIGNNYLLNIPLNKWLNGIYYIRAIGADGKNIQAKLILLK